MKTTAAALLLLLTGEYSPDGSASTLLCSRVFRPVQVPREDRILPGPGAV
jgi:hypothetical protein